MKIAILSPLKYEEAETFIRNHIRHLPFEKVVIYGGSFPYLTNNDKPSIFKKIIFKVKSYIRKKLGLRNESFYAHCLRKILLKEKVDAVFSEYLITGANATEVCKKLNIPIFSIALGYEISIKSIIKEYEYKYKKLFKYANAIFVVSKHMNKKLIELGCAEDKIVYTPAGPKNDFFKNKPLFDTLQALAVGRFVDKKAPHLTILAFKKVIESIPKAKLVMAGDGHLLNACKDLASALGLQESIDFVGKITPLEHKELLKQSYLFVQHSKVAESGDSEGTPVAILEALASGIPVVSTIHAGIPSVVIHEKSGFLVPENDFELMAERMIQLFKDKELANSFGKFGKNFVKENFTLEKHIEILSSEIRK